MLVNDESTIPAGDVGEWMRGAQLYRGSAGSTTFINVAVWESARALGRAFSSPEFQSRIARYSNSGVAAPHVFTKVAVPGICVA